MQLFFFLYAYKQVFYRLSSCGILYSKIFFHLSDCSCITSKTFGAFGTSIMDIKPQGVSRNASDFVFALVCSQLKTPGFKWLLCLLKKAFEAIKKGLFSGEYSHGFELSWLFSQRLSSRPAFSGQAGNTAVANMKRKSKSNALWGKAKKSKMDKNGPAKI